MFVLLLLSLVVNVHMRHVLFIYIIAPKPSQSSQHIILMFDKHVICDK